MRWRRCAGPWALAFLVFLSSCSGPEGRAPDDANAAAATPPSVFAYGVVEARRHSTLSARMPGKIERILVREGERVRKGQELVRFEAGPQEARVAAARAAVAVARAELARAEAGARPQEVAAAGAALAAAQARLEKAAADRDRYRDLFDRRLVSRSEWERVRLAWATAQAEARAAAERLALLREGTRKETLALLRRRLRLARARLREAEAMRAETRIVAPYDGVVTRKHREEGEALDIGLPVLDIATVRDRYVRAEIDETDVGKVRVGQRARVTADGFPGLAFEGRVVDVKVQMGPKRILPTDPGRMVDYRVLDVEVSLPEGCPFPLRLPVNVRIFTGEGG